MSSERDASPVSFLAGAVLGGTIGAIVALLFAPRSGVETRKLIKAKAKEVGEDVSEFKENVGPKIQKAREDIVKRFSK